ncbi:hypothetical protein, partial [Serratia nevei]|uniref:hypothetical protein n=1 Tax=Serratia nevei TaxID=2703794 RepID=UPI00254F72D4
RHRSVRLVILVGLAIDQIAQSGLSSLSVIYYSAQLFRLKCVSKCKTDLGLGPVPSQVSFVCRLEAGGGMPTVFSYEYVRMTVI